MTVPKPILSSLRSLPTAVTMAALVTGLMSLYVSFLAVMPGADVPTLQLRAALLIMLAMILDGLDGNLARLLNATSELGAELDTFVDLTAFGLAPAFLIYVAASGFAPWLRIAVGCALVASGAFRLARFKVIDPHRGKHGFTGLPITVCAGIVAMANVLAIKAPDSWGWLRLSLDQGPVGVGFLAFVVLLALLQVSRILYPKPSTNPVFFIVSIGLVLMLLLGSPACVSVSALAILLFGLYFILVAPFLFRPKA